MEDDHYAILGVSEEATPKEIKKAYRDKALIHHPDKIQNKDKPDAGNYYQYNLIHLHAQFIR